MHPTNKSPPPPPNTSPKSKTSSCPTPSPAPASFSKPSTPTSSPPQPHSTPRTLSTTSSRSPSSVPTASASGSPSISTRPLRTPSSGMGPWRCIHPRWRFRACMPACRGIRRVERMWDIRRSRARVRRRILTRRRWLEVWWWWWWMREGGEGKGDGRVVIWYEAIRKWLRTKATALCSALTDPRKNFDWSRLIVWRLKINARPARSRCSVILLEGIERRLMETSCEKF